MNWKLVNHDISDNLIADCGNRFLIGNGYIGVRGTLDEHGKDQLVAINLAGIYDQVGDGWREPLNAPNAYYSNVLIDEIPFNLLSDTLVSHEQSLDFFHGLHYRKTTFLRGNARITIESERFASLDNPHLLGHAYSISVSEPMVVVIETGIDGGVWDIHGPHYSDVTYAHSEATIRAHASVQKSDKWVSVLQTLEASKTPQSMSEKAGLKQMTFTLEANEKVRIDHLSAIWTSQDDESSYQQALIAVKGFKSPQYNAYKLAHQLKWESIWQNSAVKIDGDEEAEKALNYSLYHLNCAAPRHKEGLSIPARALSGQTYKGAIFWDTEIFMLDYFLVTEPEVARSFMRYRIDGLKGALEKAKSYGFEGAFYAWESQEEGFDACSDYNVTDVFTERPVRTYFKDKQVHISSAIVYAMMKYVHYTKDYSLLESGGAEVVFECARFYRSVCSRFAHETQWSIRDVIGPDEYHERIDNNAYTNKMAVETIESALEVYDLLKDKSPETLKRLNDNEDLDKLIDTLRGFSQTIKKPTLNSEGIIEQFDGYFELEDVRPEIVKSRLKDPREYWGGSHGVASETQTIKQADVVTLLALYPELLSLEDRIKNWQYYEPRTEHGSSLSACMYALLALKCQMPDQAYPFFMKSATTEIRGGGKQWAGLVYIGGTHPAAAGGAYKVMLHGFAGFDIKEGQMTFEPCLPSHWQKLSFSLNVNDKHYDIEITKEETKVLERNSK